MKLVIFKTPYKYCDFMCDSLQKNKNVILLESFQLNRNTLNGFFLWVLLRLNKKSFYKYLIKKNISNKILKNEKVYFLTFDSSNWTGDKEFIRELKKIYVNSKAAIIIYNSIENKYERVKNYNEQFDFQFTFDPYDAELYGWHYFQGLMPNKTIENINKKYDICFIGNDKGRYDKLKKLFLYLTNEGFKCFFYITSKRQKRDSIDEIILKNSGLSFEKTLQIEEQSKCILDLTSVASKRQGLSLRILEAIYCNCKIISNNKYIKDIKEIEKNSVYFENEPDICKIRKLINSDEMIDISKLNLGFEPIFKILYNEKINLNSNKFKEYWY